MERRIVSWSLKAYHTYRQTLYWYAVNCGNQFALSIQDNIEETIDLLALMPDIGRLHKTEGKRSYRSFVAHKRCIITYWYDEKSLTIARLIPTATDYTI